MSLNIYRQKRDFKHTPEPKGKRLSKARKQKLSFYIQRHAASHLHYDFRLELNNVLLSWAVPKGPCLDPAVKRLAVHVEDHPLDYGNFEGDIPKGQYGAGNVILWDKGIWIPEDDNPEKAYQKGHLTFTLKGKKLMGRWTLIRLQRDDKNWLLIKVQDEYAKKLKKYDIIKEEPDSIKQRKKSRIHLDMQHSNFPKIISPQLATLVETPPAGKQWLHEIKFDGYRILTFIRNHKVRIITRNHNDWTKKFVTLAKKLEKLNVPDVIFDGEVVSLDENQRSNFQMMQNAFKNKNDQEFIYYIFDLLYYDKYNLTPLPLTERKRILKQLFSKIKDDKIRYSDHVVGNGKNLFKKACRMGLEGIISKEATAPYYQKRTSSWQKSKCSKRQEFVIGGYTAPKNNRQHFGALLLGTYNKQGKLVYNGKVGTGFTEASLKTIYQKMIKNKVAKMPFSKIPASERKATWLNPVLVAEVQFTEWTTDNALRHPSFKGLRQDKAAKEIIREIAKRK